jgi:hypothetical protein
VETYLFSVRITPRACAIIFEAANYINPSAFPSPASEFFACETIESSLADRVGIQASLIHPSQPGVPTFRWLLTQYKPAPSSGINFEALTAVLATASSTSYSSGDGAVCDSCLQSSVRLIDECRNIGAENLLEGLGLGAPTCTNCFAAGKACQWQQADKEAAPE